MKSALTNTIQEVIQYDHVSGPVSKPIIRTQYYSVNTYVDFERDLTSRSISLSNENNQYQVYSFMPPVKTMTMGLNNYKQKYSSGNTASSFAEVLKKNLLIRCWSGYELTFDVGSGTLTDDFATRSKYVHTQLTGGAIYSDVSSYTGTVDLSSSLGTYYDDGVYDESVYAYLGYYTKTFQLSDVQPIAKSATINVSTNKFSFKYRTSRKSTMTGSAWSGYVPLSTGANVKTISSQPGDLYAQIMVRFDSSLWDTADYISTIQLNYGIRGQLFKMGTFIIDDPVLSNADVKITGRDYLRKSLETEINLQKFTNKPVTTAITYVFDRAKIPYDTSTWDLVATTISLSASAVESFQGKTAWQVLDKMMDAVNAGDDDYRFVFSEDGEPQIKKIPTDVEADWALHYHYNIENESRSLESDKQIQRITAMPKQFFTGSEMTIGNPFGSGVLSATITFNNAYYDSSNNLTSAVTGTTDNDFAYVRYIDNNLTAATGAKISAELDRTNNTIRFQFDSTAGYNVTILGCAPKKKNTYVWAERGNSDNIVNGNGSTYKNVNEFFTATTAKAYCDYFIDLAGDPKQAVTVECVANPFLQLNDNIMNISQYIYDQNIYGLVGIDEEWSDPALKHKYKMRERGFDLGAFIFDRGFDNLNGYTYNWNASSNVNALKYDTGFIWDMDISPNATGDPTEYPQRKRLA